GLTTRASASNVGRWSRLHLFGDTRTPRWVGRNVGEWRGKTDAWSPACPQRTLACRRGPVRSRDGEEIRGVPEVDTLRAGVRGVRKAFTRPRHRDRVRGPASWRETRH